MRAMLLVMIVYQFFGITINTANAKEAGSESQNTSLTEKYGTDPGQTILPEKAVDTSNPPNIVLNADDPDSKPLPYFEIAKGTYFLFGNIAVTDKFNRGWNGNAGFVVTSSGVVVIDALGTPKLGRRMIATIRSVTSKPIQYLILTHNHPDHSYGAIAYRQIKNLKIITHAGTPPYYNSTTFESSVEYRKSILPEDMRGFDKIEPDIIVDEKKYGKTSIKSGNRTFDIYNVGQHHSHGDLIVHQVEDKIVWISDLAFNNRATFMGDGHSKHAVNTLNWLLKLFGGSKLMIPGHGSAQTAPFPMVKETLAYISRLRKDMGNAFEKGISLQDAVKQSEFPQWTEVPLYDLNHPANAAHVYREMERELF